MDGKAVSAPLTVEKISDGKEYIVTSGLVPGDVIVTEGVGLMREGTPIRAKGEATAEAAASGEKSEPEAAAADGQNKEEAAVADTQNEKAAAAETQTGKEE